MNNYLYALAFATLLAAFLYGVLRLVASRDVERAVTYVRDALAVPPWRRDEKVGVSPTKASPLSGHMVKELAAMEGQFYWGYSRRGYPHGWKFSPRHPGSRSKRPWEFPYDEGYSAFSGRGRPELAEGGSRPLNQGEPNGEW